MSENGREFGQGILSIVTNHIYALALINVYFILCNSLFIMVFLLLIPSFSNMAIYFLALIPSGPAITAMFSTVSKLVREKEIVPTKDFFTSYKNDFVSSMKVWLPLLTVLFILAVDVYYFNANYSSMSQVLAGVFLIALLLISTFSFYVFYIHAQFHFRVRDVYRLAVYYSFMKVKATTGNIAIAIIAFFLMSVLSDFILLFIASLICYVVVLNSQTVRKDVKAQFVEQSQAS